MKPEIADKLRQLNRQFYQTFGESFSETRQRLQPGVLRALEGIPAEADILDLGCGNGELGRELARRGHRGGYTGLDFSAELLAEARADNPLEAVYVQADLADDDWQASLPLPTYDFVLAFAVLHHLPGEELRKVVLAKVRRLLAPGGRFVHSNWQFLNSARLRARIQPWETIGLRHADVDEGDYLLDWRRDGRALRYVHHFSEAELAELAGAAGFRVLETYYSDGEGDRLGLYEVWERA